MEETTQNSETARGTTSDQHIGGVTKSGQHIGAVTASSQGVGIPNAISGQHVGDEMMLGDVEAEEEPEPEEEKEKTICARLVLTKEQESDLMQAFNLLDYKGDGKIKAQDLRVAVKALGYEPTKEELQTLINGVDKGGSGFLSFENFQTAIMRKIMSLDSDNDIMKSFRLFDIDDTGFISFENLKAVTEILGTYLTDEEIEEMIDDADRDDDGFISVQEFMRMIKTAVHIVTP